LHRERRKRGGSLLPSVQRPSPGAANVEGAGSCRTGEMAVSPAGTSGGSSVSSTASPTPPPSTAAAVAAFTVQTAPWVASSMACPVPLVPAAPTASVFLGAITDKERRVFVHVYDLSHSCFTSALNSLLPSFGLFHTGVEVYGTEWCFGHSNEEWATGVHRVEPRRHPCHHYRGAVPMGCTRLSPTEVAVALDNIRDKWLGSAYKPFTRNCHHFTDMFCRLLGCGPGPAWVSGILGGRKVCADDIPTAPMAASPSLLVRPPRARRKPLTARLAASVEWLAHAVSRASCWRRRCPAGTDATTPATAEPASPAKPATLAGAAPHPTQAVDVV